MKKQITGVLKSLAIPTSILGFSYLRYAIELCYNDERYIHQITTRLYVDIAKEFKTTPSKVERAIRHAISISCERAGKEEYTKYFYIGSKEPTIPTNSEYIATIVDTLKLEKEA